MDEELKILWEQLAGYSGCLQDFCHRHINGEPCPDIRDTRAPREHIGRILGNLGNIYASIQAKEIPTKST